MQGIRTRNLHLLAVPGIVLGFGGCCCECCGTIPLPSESIRASTIEANPFVFHVDVEVTGERHGWVYGGGKLPNVGRPESSREVCVRVRATGEGFEPATMVTPLCRWFRGSDSKEDAEALARGIAIESCQDSAGERLVLRISKGVPPTEQGWWTLYVTPSFAAVSHLHPQAPTCAEALASLPDLDDWLVQEIDAPVDPDESDLSGNRRNFVVWGAEPIEATYGGKENITGVLAAIKLKRELPRVVDWGLRHGDFPVDEAVAVLEEQVKKGHDGDPDLQAYVLGKLLPAQGDTVSGAAAPEWFVKLAVAAPDRQHKVRVAGEVARQCREPETAPLCRAWQLATAAALARQQADASLCDALLSLVPGIYGPTEQHDEVGEGKVLWLLKYLHSCASKPAFHRAVLASFDLPASATMQGAACALSDPIEAPWNCMNIHSYASAWLAQDCGPDVVAKLQPIANGPTKAGSAKAGPAACVLARCDAPEACSEMSAHWYPSDVAHAEWQCGVKICRGVDADSVAPEASASSGSPGEPRPDDPSQPQPDEATDR